MSKRERSATPEPVERKEPRFTVEMTIRTRSAPVSRAGIESQDHPMGWSPVPEEGMEPRCGGAEQEEEGEGSGEDGEEGEEGEEEGEEGDDGDDGDDNTVSRQHSGAGKGGYSEGDGGDGAADEEEEEFQGFDEYPRADSPSGLSGRTAVPFADEGEPGDEMGDGRDSPVWWEEHDDDDVSDGSGDDEDEEADDAPVFSEYSTANLIRAAKPANVKAEESVAKHWGPHSLDRLLDPVLIPKNPTPDMTYYMGRIVDLPVARWNRKLIFQLGALAAVAKIDDANRFMLEAYEERLARTEGRRLGVQAKDVLEALAKATQPQYEQSQ
ncbi:hypothetical protein LTR82_008233 [Friedmanniomyces endolithicus]|uniref:Uncharacterized protein n=1 Tax=Friedmanniomyces endolithicus TaxID=329885 RepID=A0AAN6FRG1_9PEZI|nr:hypothetical protein LTR82_008233 [Friedmanniomyces endolithicus]